MDFYTFNLENYIANDYLRAFLILVIWLFIIRVGLMIFERLILKITSKTKSNVDDLIIKKSSKPLTFLSFLISFLIAFQEVQLVENVSSVITKTANSLIVLTIGYLIYVIVDIVLVKFLKKITAKTESDLDDSLIGIGEGVLRFAAIVIFLIYVLNIWGIEITPLLAGLGIAGLAIALALQPTLSNIVAGVSLIIDKTFKVGDVIKLESGEFGSVFKIGLRTTRIKTFDNEMLIIPNSNLANSKVQNFFQPDLSIRVNVDFGVAYGVDPEFIKKITIEEIEKIQFIDKSQEIRVLFLSMGDSALNFKAMFWVDDISKKWPAHQEAISRIYRRLYKENIEIPFPQTTVWTRDEGKAKSQSPFDKKFSKYKDKYFSNFGHEYKEEK
jgi:MscS family membrane protein